MPQSGTLTSPPQTGAARVDLGDSILHLVSFTEHMRQDTTVEDLRAHPHVHAERPDWSPYRTSYHARICGFGLSRNQLEAPRGGDVRGGDRQDSCPRLADVR